MPEQNGERKVIKVASIMTPNPKFPTLLEFKGEDGVKYETWVKALATEVQLGAELDCDITHSKKEGESGIFYHHKITQIYKEGKPVYQAETKPGGRSYGKSKEEQRSIERQTSIKLACEISSDNDLLEAILQKAEQIYKWISST